jgi:hypothetical protein
VGTVAVSPDRNSKKSGQSAPESLNLLDFKWPFQETAFRLVLLGRRIAVIPEIQEQLVSAYGPKTDRAVYRAVMEGVLLADEHLTVVPFMSTPIGRDLQGHFRRAGIMYSMKQYCDRGDLPFEAEFQPMPIGVWHWIEIKSEGVLAHVCRTEDAGAFPQNTTNRQDARLTNQLSLFEPKVVTLHSQLYAWLMVRANKDGALSHLCWGAPAANNDEWLAYRNILSAIGSAPIEPPAPRQVDPKDKLRFHDHVQEGIEKTSKKKEEDDK